MTKKLPINIIIILFIKFILIPVLSVMLSVGCQRDWDEPLKIVYVQGNNIWTMDEDGNKKTQLTNLNLDNYPVFSPDGQSILFVRSNTQLWIMTWDGSGERLIFNRTPNLVSYPTFSPDGGDIAYVDDTPSIRIIDSSGGGDHSIYTAGNSAFLSWSPDGNWIIFEGFPTTTIFRISSSGGTATEIIASGSRGVSYSPDGLTIAGIGGGGGGYIRIWSKDGLQLQEFLNTPINSLSAAWSPDGESIVLEDIPGNIYTMQKNGTNIRLIATSGSLPSFQGKPR